MERRSLFKVLDQKAGMYSFIFQAAVRDPGMGSTH